MELDPRSSTLTLNSMSLTMQMSKLNLNMVDTIWLLTNDVIR